MRRPPAVLLAALLIALTGCDTDGSPEPSTTATTAPTTALEAGGQGHIMLPLESVNDVMHAKLAHVHAVLEGICMQDYRQIEVNATALERLSSEAGWRVHTMVAYTVMSDQFAAIAAALAEDARTQDADGVARGYVAMTGACLACHDYLRREGLYRDAPGAVSMRRPEAADGTGADPMKARRAFFEIN